MSHQNMVEVDVRPLLESKEAKEEPLDKIMCTVQTLKPGDTLVLHTIFKPTPLIKVLEWIGFKNEAFHESEQHWKVHFGKALNNKGE